MKEIERGNLVLAHLVCVPTSSSYLMVITAKYTGDMNGKE